MDSLTNCPKCNFSLRPADNFCANCGFAVVPQKPSISFFSQFFLYLKSTLLPPFGTFWALPYLKQSEIKYKVVGAIALTLTWLSLLFTVKATIDMVHTVNTQINSQLNLIEGGY